MEAYHRYRRPLSVAERNRYLAEQALIGRMGGADAVPETVADLEDYVEAMRPKMAVTGQTREFFEFLLTSPLGLRLPGPLARRSNRFQIESGMGLMPRWAQELTGFEPSPLAWRTLHEPMLHAYARTLRWAFGRPSFRALADERVARGTGEREQTVARAAA
jgi:uncharacterized protein (DUF2236 family)